MLAARRAAAHRRGRRDHQRGRRRSAGRVRRAVRRARDPDADGLGRDPGRPSADGRNGGPADLASLRQRDDARGRLRARHRQPLGQPAHRRARRLPRGAHVRPRRHRADPDRAGLRRRTTASCPTPAPRSAVLLEVARERRRPAGCPTAPAWAEQCRERKRTMLRRTHYDDAPIKPQRVYEEMNKAFGPTTRYVSTIGLSQIAAAQFLHVLPAAALDQRGQAGPLGWTVPAALGVCVADPDADRRRPHRRLRLPVHDGGAGGRGAVQPAVRARAGEQRLPRADPPVAARLRHGLLRAAVLRQRQRRRARTGTASTTSRWPRAWAARRCGSSSRRTILPALQQASKLAGRAPGAGGGRGHPRAGHQHLHGHGDRQRRRVRGAGPTLPRDAPTAIALLD